MKKYRNIIQIINILVIINWIRNLILIMTIT